MEKRKGEVEFYKWWMRGVIYSNNWVNIEKTNVTFPPTGNTHYEKERIKKEIGK